MGFCGTYLRPISQEVLKYQFEKCEFEICTYEITFISSHIVGNHWWWYIESLIDISPVDNSRNISIIFVSCDQAALRMAISVCLSVCPSVCDTFLTMFPPSYHHEIFRSYYQWPKWCPCKRSRSKVKVTEVKTQLNRFRTVTPVWIHIWWWNDGQSLMMLRRGALLFLRSSVKFQGHTAKKNRQFWPKLGVSGL